jgi:hypothetical protein
MDGFMVSHEGEPLTLRNFNSRKRTRKDRLSDLGFILMGVTVVISGWMVIIPIFLSNVTSLTAGSNCGIGTLP